MKKILIILRWVLVLGGLTSVTSCGPDDAPTLAETERVAAAMRSGTWIVQSVMVDGVDRTSLYGALILKFTESSFTATNGGPVWPASGTWSFSDDTGKSVTRSDALKITVVEADASKLVLKLTWSKSTVGPGRAASVSGEHVFSLKK